MNGLFDTFVGGAAVGGVAYIILTIINKNKSRKLVNKIESLIDGKISRQELADLMEIDEDRVLSLLEKSDIIGLVKMRDSLLNK